MHGLTVQSASPCSFLNSLEQVAVNPAERIEMLNGYDLRNLQCELLEFAPASIGGEAPVPFKWRGADVVCWNGDVQCPPEVDFAFLELADKQYSCQRADFHCTGP